MGKGSYKETRPSRRTHRFVMGAVASAFLTFGIAMIYATTGKLDILQSLSPNVQTVSTPAMLLGLSLILIGIGFKVSMGPLHLWTPDVYQGAPAPVTAFLSTGSKVVLFGALLRFAYYYSGSTALMAHIHPWRSAFLTVCLLSLAGLPPTAGFMGKFILFRAVLEARFVILALIGVATVAVSIYFYFKIVVALFMNPAGRKVATPDLDLSARVAGVVILLLILWLGLLPSSLLSIITRIVSSL